MKLVKNRCLSGRGFRVGDQAQLLILLLLFPLILIPQPLTNLVLLVIPLQWLIRKRRTGNFILPTPADGSILLLLIMVLISLFATFDIHFSATRVALIVYGIAVYYATAAVASLSKKWLTSTAGLLLISGWIVASLSLVGTRWTDKLTFLASLTDRLPQRVVFLAAPEGFSPNQVAGVLLWVLPVFLALMITELKSVGRLRGDRVRGDRVQINWLTLPLLMFGSLFLLGTFILTQSRSGYFGLAVAILVMFLIPLFERRPGAAIALVFLILLGGILLIVLWPSMLSDSVKSLASESNYNYIDSLSTTVSLEGRLEIWSRALYGLEDFPLTGMGVGTFRRVVPMLYPLTLVGLEVDIAHAHNLFLQVGLDMGFLGLIAYVAIWLAAGFMLWRVWRARNSGSARVLAVGFAGALVGYFVYGMTETVAPGAKPGFIFWLLLGLISGMHHLVTTTD